MIVLRLAALSEFGWAAWLVTQGPAARLAAIFCAGLGIAFAMASQDSRPNQPVLAGGLLSKIAIPCWIWVEAVRGYEWTVLAHDVVWVAPLAVLVWRARAFERAGEDIVRTAAIAPVDRLLDRYRTEGGENLARLAEGGPLLLVFLRQTGCTFCRETVEALAEQAGSLRRAGLRIVLIHHSSPESLAELTGAKHLHGVDVVHDAERRLYRDFGLRRGSLLEVAGPLVWIRGLWTGLARGQGIGRLDGDPRQMPGMFLIEGGKVIRGMYPRSAASKPDFETISRLASLKAKPEI